MRVPMKNLTTYRFTPSSHNKSITKDLLTSIRYFILVLTIANLTIQTVAVRRLRYSSSTPNRRVKILGSKNIEWKPRSNLSSKFYIRYGNTKLMLLDSVDIGTILMTHNFIRATVDPPAQDMLMIKWHPKAQELAGNWAKKCITNHDKDVDRTPTEFRDKKCGQNTAFTSKWGGWDDVIYAWAAEKYDYNYGGPQRYRYQDNNVYMPNIGHYIQLVWSSTEYVGCAVSYCPNSPKGLHYHWVCNYCPLGNLLTEMNFPYTKSYTNQTCSKCLERGVCQNSGPFGGRLYASCDKLCQNSLPNCHELYLRYYKTRFRRSYLYEKCPRQFDPRCSDFYEKPRTISNRIDRY